MMVAMRQEMFPIEEASQVARARRGAVELARAQGLDEVAAGNVAIAVTEAATNILKHAQSGQVLLRPLGGGPDAGVEVIALDRGPGIADLGASLRDGHSTAATPGTGLGAMQRLANGFDAYTAPGKGSVFRLAFQRAAPAASLEFGVVSLPVRGETECGDGWGVRASADGTDFLLMVADGLGHGPEAAGAARAAEEALQKSRHANPDAVLEDVHAALKATRGAAVGIVRFGKGGDKVVFSGVGNTACGVYQPDGESKQFASRPGIAGHNLRKTDQFSQPWSDSATLILYSDGLATHWNFKAYPGLLARHPALIAAVLYRDLARGRDDVTVLVARIRETQHG